jgi:cholinesterase
MNIRKLALNFTLSVMATLSINTHALDQGFDELIIFSGSLEDTGNINTLIGDAEWPFWNNRSTNGPSSVDVFAEELGFNAEPSLHLIGQVGGNNFAVRGATTGGSGPTDLPAQMDAYFARTGGVAKPNSLYLVFIGGHDVIQAVIEPDMEVSKQIIKNAVIGLENQLKRLIDAGAKNIYAPSFIDISAAPVFQGPGISDKAHYLSKLYHDKFNRMLDRVERQKKLRIFRFSFWDFVKENTEMGRFIGFTNTTDPCITTQNCDFEKFIFLTDTFPTAKVHRLLGNALALDLFHQLTTCEAGNWHKSTCPPAHKDGKDKHK